MKCMWTAGVLALVVAAVATTPAGAATGGNADNATLCQKDGWKTLYRDDGSTFASQGDCVSYGAKGNTILAEPPNAWKAACEQNFYSSGTFSVSHTDLITGLPLPPPQYAYLCIPASLGAYDVVLNQICIEYPDLVFSEWRLLNGAIGAAACVRAGTA